MTKKAKRIMTDTYCKIKRDIKIFGYDGNGYTGMYDPYNELIYKRTMNEMRDILTNWKRNNERNYKLRIINENEYKLECQIYDVLEKTMNNQYIAKSGI